MCIYGGSSQNLSYVGLGCDSAPQGTLATPGVALVRRVHGPGGWAVQPRSPDEVNRTNTCSTRQADCERVSGPGKQEPPAHMASKMVTAGSPMVSSVGWARTPVRTPVLTRLPGQEGERRTQEPAAQEVRMEQKGQAGGEVRKPTGM